MYLWRKLTEGQRRELLAFRRSNRRPWHSPPHRVSQNGRYLLTAACYEHRHFIGETPKRLADFSSRLLKTLEIDSEEIYAWCVLPNHYHALILTRKLPVLLVKLAGIMDGRLSTGTAKRMSVAGTFGSIASRRE